MVFVVDVSNPQHISPSSQSHNTRLVAPKVHHALTQCVVHLRFLSFHAANSNGFFGRIGIDERHVLFLDFVKSHSAISINLQGENIESRHPPSLVALMTMA